MAKVQRFTGKEKEVLVLRACDSNRRSMHDFQYPRKGYVRVRTGEWDPYPNCGNGLHGWVWGFGNKNIIPQYARPRGKWLVIRVQRKNLIYLEGKIKFKSGHVVFCGTKRAAGQYVRARRPQEDCDGGGWPEIIRH